MFRVVALLVHVLSLAAAQTFDEANAVFLTNNQQKEGVVTLPSGLQYKIVESGPAEGAHPGPDHQCTCHYEGTLVDGRVFDSSRK